MKRRDFCVSALAAGISASIPACSRAPSGSNVTGTISAVSGAGEELTIERTAIAELADSLAGRLYLPEDTGYDVVRKVWNGMIDKRPAMIVQCRSIADAANAVTFAGERGLLVAVKGGGHSFPGKSTCDGGMMIDLSQMRAVDVNAEQRVARVEGGALLGHLDGAAMEHGLLTTTGIVSHTGVGGFTLGGGLGRTDRLHGLAVDNVVGATVVTADGEIRRASAEENPDLFWAIRGGGGNFGVVTQFDFALHPFNPDIYGGVLVWSFDQAKDVLRFWVEFNETLPNAANVEPQWYINDDGDREFIVEVCYAGDHAEGEKVMAPLVAFGKRLGGELGAVPYRQMQTQADAFMGYDKLNYLKSGFIVDVTDAAIDTMIDAYEGEDLPWGWFQHQGGSMADVGSSDTAFFHRDASINFGISYLWEDPSMTDSNIAMVREYYNAMAPHMKGFYTNLNEASEKKTWGNYGENYPRLVEVKNKYDPGNLFRLNANIQPSV